MASDINNTGCDNLRSGETEEYHQVDDDFIPDDACPLCSKCLKACHPLQYYCDGCDSNEVINPLASYMPFIRIRFNIGMLVKAWRKMVYGKESSIAFRLVCLLIIILWLARGLVH
jgi:hypothetical protein